MKRLLLSFAMMIGMLAGLRAQTTYTLVTDASTLADGDEVIIVAESADKAMGSANSNNFSAVDITKTGATIAVAEGSGVLPLTLKGSAGAWQFFIESSSLYLCSASSGNNYLRTNADGTLAQTTATVEITAAGAATVKFNGQYTRNWVRYNSQSDIFACYASGQQGIAIYKKQVSADPDPDPAEITDVLNYDNTTKANTSNSYADIQGVKVLSSAVYDLQAANGGGSNPSIQLRSSNNNSGIVSVKSGGDIKKVAVAWNASSASGRTLNIYGSNEAYTSPSNLYNAETRGTLLGTIVNGTSTELEITGSYTYVGIRSNSGALYLDEVALTWDASTLPTTLEGKPAFSIEGGQVEKGTTVELTASVAGASIYYTMGEAPEDPTIDNGTLYTAPISIEEKTVIKAVMYKDGLYSEVASASFSLKPSFEVNLSDMLTPSTMGLDGSTTYADYTDIKLGSGAEYAAQCSNGTDIQLRSNNSNSGIIVTKSAGRVTKIIITWNAATSNGRVLNVYGKNEPYASPAELYGSSTQGTLIQAVTFTKVDGEEPVLVAEITPDADYEYIGLRSASGALYLQSVEVQWAVGIYGDTLPFGPTFSPASGTFIAPGGKVAIESPIEGAEIYYTIGDSSNDYEAPEPTVATGTKYTEPIAVEEYIIIRAILSYQDRVSEEINEGWFSPYPDLYDFSAIDDLGPGVPFIMREEVTTLYANGKYAYLTDGTYNVVVYDNNGVPMATGDVLAADWTGLIGDYHGLTQITLMSEVEIAGKAESLPQPIEWDAEEAEMGLKPYNVNRYATLMGVAFAEDTPASGNFTGTMAGEEGDLEIAFRNQFGIAGVPADTYKVTGFVGIYDGAVQFYPTKFTPTMAFVSSVAEAEALVLGRPFEMEMPIVTVYTYVGEEPEMPQLAPAKEEGEGAEEGEEGQEGEGEGEEPAVYTYAYIYDGTTFGLMCTTQEIEAKAIVFAGWQGTVLADAVLMADTELSVSQYSATGPQPENVSAAKLAKCANREYVALSNVLFDDSTPADAVEFAGDMADATITFCNKFGLESVEAGEYDVVGFVERDAEGNVTVLPISFTALGQGIQAVEADSEARYYNLQGLEVLNPQRGSIYIRVAGGSASKVIIK